MGSTTIALWLVLLGIAFAVIVLATAAQYFGLNPPYIEDFFRFVDGEIDEDEFRSNFP